MILPLLAVAGCGIWKPGFSAPNGAQDAACNAVAINRASDAGMAGEDDRTQQEVWKRTYDDCVTWRQGHGPG